LERAFWCSQAFCAWASQAPRLTVSVQVVPVDEILMFRSEMGLAPGTGVRRRGDHYVVQVFSMRPRGSCGRRRALEYHPFGEPAARISGTGAAQSMRERKPEKNSNCKTAILPATFHRRRPTEFACKSHENKSAPGHPGRFRCLKADLV